MVDKTRGDAVSALRGVSSGATIAVGGFGGTGVPFGLVDALCALDLKDLHIVSNNCGQDEVGLAKLLTQRRIRKFTGSFPGSKFAKEFLAGRVELELVPQGTLAERLRAGGSGLPGFYVPASAGTLLGDGGMPTRYDSDGTAVAWGAPKERREFDGVEYVLERAIVADFALVRAHRGDTFGNLRFRLTARNFNPVAAMAGLVTVAEVEHLEPLGAIAPDDVHLPGSFVDHVVVSETSSRPDRVAPQVGAVTS